MSKNLTFRKAQLADLPDIIEMLADDFLGKSREEFLNPLPDFYLKAFEEINQSSENFLLVVDTKEKSVVATMQMTFTSHLVRQASKRLTIEALRVHKNFRSQKIGEAMMNFAISEAKKRGCKIVQFTTDKERGDAHRFYEKLGFQATHLGFKKHL
jgi:ribosomal protein S18 acetylase RimI-like enzyme